MAGGEQFVVAALQVQDEVDGGREALVPVLAEQVAVGCGQEAVRRERAEQPAEGAGQQQGPGAGLHPLAGDVGQDDLQGPAAVGAGGDDEVPGEGLAAGRAQGHLAVPASGQGGQLALHPDAFAQVEEHGAAAPPGDADAAAELGDDQSEESAGGDDEDGAGGDARRALGVGAQDEGLDDQCGRGGGVQGEEAGGAQQQAPGDDRQDEGGGREPDGEHQGAARYGGDGEQESGEGEPVGGVASEVVDGGFAQGGTGPVRQHAHPGHEGLHACSGHCFGTLSTQAVNAQGYPRTGCFRVPEKPPIVPECLMGMAVWLLRCAHCRAMRGMSGTAPGTGGPPESPSAAGRSGTRRGCGRRGRRCGSRSRRCGRACSPSCRRTPRRRGRPPAAGGP